MSLNSQIDNTDLQILSILMEDAQTPYTEIANRLIISGGTVHVRMKKLIRLGVVRGSHLEVNPELLGYDVCAFVGMFLEKGSFYNELVEKLKGIPAVTEVHYTTGVYSIFMKIVCRNTRELRNILNEQIQPLPGVQRTETFISLEESIIRQLQILPDESS